MTDDELRTACHEMLGIHPSEQPADFYRLLALSRRESNPVVISNAAECRMNFVRQLASGPCGHAAAEVLAMLAEARLCLLNDARKRDYDAMLKGNASRPTLAEVTSHLESWIIGSSSKCDVVVEEPFVSKRHCRLTRQDGVVLLEDLKSRNGTFVNGAQVDGEQRQLVGDDIVTLGRKTRLKWRDIVGASDEA